MQKAFEKFCETVKEIDPAFVCSIEDHGYSTPNFRITLQTRFGRNSRIISQCGWKHSTPDFARYMVKEILTQYALTQMLYYASVV